MPTSDYPIALLAAAICAGPLACLRLDPDAPLGSIQNPIRAHRFSGELDYLSRLRCADGTRPQTQGLRRRVKGPYGNPLDGYRVRCIYLNAESQIYIDPFHEDHIEQRAARGFSAALDPRSDWRLRALWEQR